MNVKEVIASIEAELQRVAGLVLFEPADHKTRSDLYLHLNGYMMYLSDSQQVARYKVYPDFHGKRYEKTGVIMHLRCWFEGLEKPVRFAVTADN